jgi:hypothetical protein
MNAKTVENIVQSLDGIDEMVANLRKLADAGTKMGDDLTRCMDSMARGDRFNAAMELWRQFSKVNAAVAWIDLNARIARRNTNSLLSEIPEGVEA